MISLPFSFSHCPVRTALNSNQVAPVHFQAHLHLVSKCFILPFYALLSPGNCNYTKCNYKNESLLSTFPVTADAFFCHGKAKKDGFQPNPSLQCEMSLHVPKE